MTINEGTLPIGDGTVARGAGEFICDRDAPLNEFSAFKLTCRNIDDKSPEIRADYHKPRLAETPQRGFNAHAYGNTHEAGTRSYD